MLPTCLFGVAEKACSYCYVKLLFMIWEAVCVCGPDGLLRFTVFYFILHTSLFGVVKKACLWYHHGDIQWLCVRS